MDRSAGSTIEMDTTALNDGGFVETSVKKLLGLTAEEVYVIDLRNALTKEVRGRRVAAGLSQTDVAKKMGSSQSRVAAMESHCPNIFFDLLIRALLAVERTPAELGALIAAVPAPTASAGK